MFITLEGIDRSGKTTQAALLAEALGPETLLLREPGGTDAGERIREILKTPDLELNIGAELLLFGAARAQLAATVIGPAADQGREIVCDRYIDSTVAYQAAALGELYVDEPGREGRGAFEIGRELVEQMNTLVVGGCVPDLTLADPDRRAGGSAPRPATRRERRARRRRSLRSARDRVSA